MIKNKRPFIIFGIDFCGVVLATLFLIIVLKLKISIIFFLATCLLLTIANIFSGAYKQLWRYTSFREVQNLFLSNIFAFSALLILNSLTLININALGLFNFFSFYFLYSVIVRGIRRIYVTQSKKSTEKSNQRLNVLVIGAGNSASTLIKHILTDKKDIKICGIIDNDTTKIGAQIHGIKVVGDINFLDKALETFNIKQVIIAMPSAPKQLVKSISSQLILN